MTWHPKFEKIDRKPVVPVCKGGTMHKVPTAPLRKYLEPLIEELGVEQVADLGRLSSRSFYRVLHTSSMCSLEMAERIIVDILDDPSIWFIDPVLREHYVPSSRIGEDHSP